MVGFTTLALWLLAQAGGMTPPGGAGPLRARPAGAARGGGEADDAPAGTPARARTGWSTSRRTRRTSTRSTSTRRTGLPAHHQPGVLADRARSRGGWSGSAGRSASGVRAPTVGTFLELLVTGPGTLIGSGHPDQAGELPSFLGVLRSDDAGRTWRVLAARGRRPAQDRRAPWPALRLRRRPRSDARSPPTAGDVRGAVHPAQPHHRLRGGPGRSRAPGRRRRGPALRSADGGEVWRPLGSAEASRLAWPAAGALYRATLDGTVEKSRDGGVGGSRPGRCPASRTSSRPWTPSTSSSPSATARSWRRATAAAAGRRRSGREAARGDRGGAGRARRRGLRRAAEGHSLLRPAARRLTTSPRTPRRPTGCPSG